MPINSPVDNPAPDSPNTDLDSIDLAQQKIDQRLQLLSLPPLEAQKLADQTLYPQFWKLRTDVALWDESIPSKDAETNA